MLERALSRRHLPRNAIQKPASTIQRRAPLESTSRRTVRRETPRERRWGCYVGVADVSAVGYGFSALCAPAERLSRPGVALGVAVVSVALLISCLFPLASHSGECDARASQELQRQPFYPLFFGSFWKQASHHDAPLFLRHIRSNWATQPTPSRRWWRRKKPEAMCETDLTDPQIQAIHGLMHRVFPSLVGRIDFSRTLDCRDPHKNCFSAEILDEKLCIRGSSGVELAMGLHWFIKSECKGLSTWKKTGGTHFMEGCLSSDHVGTLKDSFQLYRERQVPLSLYQNVVTSSYSMAFWDWDRWEAEIDWMALHGVNFPLALAGQEYIWVKVFEEFGVSYSDLADFFTGPAFLAWGRMGNLQGYGGPLPWSYIHLQAELQKRIVSRMRDFGMTPVFSAFAGFVPRALLRRFPTASAKKSSNWCAFPEQHCCVWLLDPQDPLFHRIGAGYVQKLRAEYGMDRVGFYAVDVFNEMAPTQSNPSYLERTSEAVYSAMAASDASAIWLMQGWLFYSDREFWKPPQIQAVLSGVPHGKLLLLDLYAERHPQWKRTEAFFGHPFIWCNLHNFGGNSEMHGAMPQIAQGLSDALTAQTNVVGMGMCPEGLEQNPVVYELSSEVPFHASVPDLEPWFQSYAVQRYAGRECSTALRAWKMLSESVYENTAHRPETVMDITTSRPGLTSSEAVWGLKPQIWYNPNKVIEAWDGLLQCQEALKGLSAYHYDLIDVGRQVLSKLATKYWKLIEAAYSQRDIKSFHLNGDRLLELMRDIDELVSTHEGFLLAPVLHEARRMGETEDEKRLMERNLKTQLTIWGHSPDGDTELSDYANKQWSGLIQSFYTERWRIWLARRMEDLKKKREYDSQGFRQQIVEFTHKWIEADNLGSFLAEPMGDPVQVSQKLFSKYRDEAWVLEMAV